MMSSFDVNIIKERITTLKDMPTQDFITYMGIDPSVPSDFIEHLRLYYTDVNLLRKSLRSYFKSFILSNNAIVRRIGSSCIDIFVSDLYNSSANKMYAKRALKNLGFECVYCTIYGHFELINMTSDIEKVIKKFEADKSFWVNNYKDRL